ncbi:hypothetical protein OPT61_g52 [Boeremia exigua]|uniref:Uncharacterized protein n=1 Tax=Boeremia exigua TaxID=749465 RepID=A0ACC2IV80_9PLEO|nr:hypothetical protein OPT61_g52 [Boeremia exigua]
MRVRTNLEEDGHGDLFQFVDWTVQEDPGLDEAHFETDDDMLETLRERYATYAADHPEDVNYSIPRSMAFIAVTQDHVRWVLEGPGPEKYSSEEGFLDLVAVDPEDGSTQAVTLSLVFPRVYSLIDSLGFDHICIGEDDIFAHDRNRAPSATADHTRGQPLAAPAAAIVQNYESRTSKLREQEHSGRRVDCSRGRWLSASTAAMLARGHVLDEAILAQKHENKHLEEFFPWEMHITPDPPGAAGS